jgi:3-oxoacyl-[acyl-carrier-protein] synthase II
MNRRVVITGAGVISSVGFGVDEFWRHCLQAKSVVTPVPSHWNRYADLHSRVWSPLPDIDFESSGITRIERLQLDPVSVFAIEAAHEALGRAGYTLRAAAGKSRTFIISDIDPSRFGVYLGTGIGGAYSFLHNHAHHLYERPRAIIVDYAKKRAPAENQQVLSDIATFMMHGPRFNPFVVSMLMPNAVSAAVGIKFSLTGPNLTYCVACASGTVAVGNAYRAVRDGHVDVAVSGGSEYLADDHGAILRGFDVAGTLVRDYTDPETANRPFDRDRSGFLFSQGGAAVLVLEELEHARRRGVTPIAEVVGFAETFDAHSMMSLAPGGEQIERMIRAALADADLTPRDVDYVNAHGTGTKNNDQTEAEVIDRVFGQSVRVNSTKSLIGHTIGASGAIEALVTALSLRDGMTHVCKNLVDPVIDLNFVRVVERFDPSVGLSQSFAFGGHNAAVVLRRFE